MPPRGTLVLLDDLQVRVDAARDALDDAGAGEIQLLTAVDVPSFERLLPRLPVDLLAFSLDYHLGSPRIDEDGRHDPGTGTDAVILLRDLGLCLPVLAHSSDSIRGPGMLTLLPGWPCDYVPLHTSLEGSRRWAQRLLELIAEGSST